MKSYKELEIYHISYRLALRVHGMSLKLPKFELFEEGEPVRKSSKGITACIVEGYGRRRYKPDFIKFLTYAHASCDETIVHLDFIRDTHSETEPNEVKGLVEECDGLGRKLNRFIRYVEERWMTPPTPTRNS